MAHLAISEICHFQHHHHLMVAGVQNQRPCVCIYICLRCRPPRHLQHHCLPVVAEVQNHRPPPHQNQRHISSLTWSSSSESLTLILDLMDSAYSQLDDLMCRLDRSPSKISKDVEAFHSLLHESLKAFQQLNDEVDKEIRWEKMRKIIDALKAMMGLMEAAKTSPCHESTTSVVEYGQTFKKFMDVSLSRLGGSTS